jgi:hypothetical protein
MFCGCPVLAAGEGAVFSLCLWRFRIIPADGFEIEEIGAEPDEIPLSASEREWGTGKKARRDPSAPLRFRSG